MNEPIGTPRLRRSFRSFVGQEAIERQGKTAEEWALSSECSQAYDIFASIATGGALDFAGVQRAVLGGSLSQIDHTWLARLGRVVALQTSEARLEEFALQALRASVPGLSQNSGTMRLRRVLFEMLLGMGHDAEADEALSRDEALRNYYHGYLVADLINPYRSGNQARHETWLAAFNRPLTECGLQPVFVDPQSPVPFDALTGSGTIQQVWGPLVSVVVTTFNPVRRELFTAVRSVLNQSWRNLEVIVVDDKSNDVPQSLFDELARLDSRVRVVRLPENRGTYVARNAGIERARGEFVTGQDTDDWSHPQRLERQMELFNDDPGLPGVMTVANRTDDNLVRAHRGSLPERRCEVSLMFRKRDARAVGGYLSVRKAGDSEFRSRLETVAEREVGTVREPLYFIRLSEGSLSRGDFRGGWSHPTRRGFRNLYAGWHRQAHVNLARYGDFGASIEVPFEAPRRFVGGESGPRAYDVVFVADWRGDARSLDSPVTEIRVAARHGLRVGILQQDSPFLGLGAKRDFDPSLSALLACGTADLVYLDEEIRAQLVLVRDVATLNFARALPSSWSAKRVAIGLDFTPVFEPEHQRRFDPEYCAGMAETIFGVRPTWFLPPSVGSATLAQFDGLSIGEEAFPFVVDLPRFSGVRKKFEPDNVVVGRTAENAVTDWPSGKKNLRSAYPVNGEFDVRILGDARGALRSAGLGVMPAGWLSFRDREVRSDIFWRRVDFCVQHDQSWDPILKVREMLEAIAAGAVVVADPKYAEFLGDAMVPSRVHEVGDVIETFSRDPERYLRASRAAFAFVEREYGGTAFVAFLSRASVPAKR